VRSYVKEILILATLGYVHSVCAVCIPCNRHHPSCTRHDHLRDALVVRGRMDHDDDDTDDGADGTGSEQSDDTISENAQRLVSPATRICRHSTRAPLLLKNQKPAAVTVIQSLKHYPVNEKNIKHVLAVIKIEKNMRKTSASFNCKSTTTHRRYVS